MGVRVIEDFDTYGDQAELYAVWVDHQGLDSELARTLVANGGTVNN